METEGIRRQLRNTNIGDAAEQIHRLLPEDIIIEILSRLAVKSVLRFKCVSKSWRCLISSKYFVKTHLESSGKKGEALIISYDGVGDLRACSLPIKQDTRAFSFEFYPTNNFTRDLRFVGSCNGLICVLVDRYQLFVWNPATRESNQLPDFFSDLLDHFGTSIVTCGFGFDESSGDYKVFAASYDASHRFIKKVYSLKADSWVRSQDGPLLFKDGISPFDATFKAGEFASGKLHWRTKELGLKSKWEIVCLDLKSETFGIVEQPSPLNDYSLPSLGVLKDRLCVLFDCPQSIGGLDIWIWNEYGVEDSWAKFATIPYPSLQDECGWRNYITPLHIFPNEEVLLTYKSSFYIYSPKTRDFWECAIIDFDYVCVTVVYTESLVSITRSTHGVMMNNVCWW